MSKNETTTYSATANSSGQWHIKVTSDLKFGDYEVKAKNGLTGDYSPASHFNVFGSYIEDFSTYGDTSQFNSYKAEHFLIEAFNSGAYYRPKIQYENFKVEHGTLWKPSNTGAKITFDETLYSLQFDINAYEQQGSSTITAKFYFLDGSSQEIKLTNNTADIVRHTASGRTGWGTFTLSSASKGVVSIELKLSGNPGSYTQSWWFDNFIMGSTAPKPFGNISTTEVIESNHEVDLSVITLDKASKIKVDGEYVLDRGEKNKFIKDDDSLQLLIKGSFQDAIQLEGATVTKEFDAWIKSQGFVVIAGVKYVVYTLKSKNIKVLIDSSVKIEFIDPNTPVAQENEQPDLNPPTLSILGAEITSNGTELRTSKTQPTFTSSVPGQTSGIVVIWIDNDKYTAEIQPDGRFTFTPTKPLDEGLHNVSIHAIKLSGLIGDPTLFTLHIDTTAPDLPIIEIALDDQGMNTGARLSGEKTDDRNPVLRGDAEPGSIIRIYEGSILLGSVTTAANGIWQKEITLSDGLHTLTATATDRLGNTSGKSLTFEIHIGDDAPLPSIGAVTIDYAKDNVGGITKRLQHGAITDDTTPELHGSAAVGSTVRIQYRSGSGKWIDGANASVSGTDWTWTPNPALSEGNFEFRANAGSGWSDEFQLDIYLTPADRTEITHAWDNVAPWTGELLSGASTDDTSPELHGKAEAYSQVYLFYRQAITGIWYELGDVQAGADGKWSYDPGRFAPGEWEFKASSVKNGSIEGAAFRLSLTAKNNIVPTIDYAEDNEGHNVGQLIDYERTDDRTPTLHGSAEANSTIYIYYTLLGLPDEISNPVTVGTDGKWHWTPSEELKNGKWSFKAVAGTLNSQTFHLELNPITEDSYKITHAIDDFGAAQGTLLSGALTDDVTPTLHGYGIPNSKIYLRYYETGKSATANEEIKVGADGLWSWSTVGKGITASANNWNFEIQRMGDTKWSQPFELKIITAQIPTIAAWNDDGINLIDILHNGSTSDSSPKIHGTAEANSTINLEYGKSTDPWSNTKYPIKVKSDGTWEWTPPVDLTNAKWNFRASNSAGTSSVFSFTLSNKLYFWDFDDKTLQGWTAVGDYAKNNDLVAKSLGGTPVLFSYTNTTGSSYNGEVAYNTIQVEAGKTYTFSYKIARYDGRHSLPKIGFTVDGTQIIPETEITTGWKTKTGTYVATQTKLVKIAFTNGESSGNGNDFQIDDITVTATNTIKSNGFSSSEILSQQNGVIDITHALENSKKITTDDILAQSQKNLFIANDHEQVIIIGNEKSVLSLHDIISSEDQLGHWTEQAGLITIAGIEYTVYSNDNNREVLVQHDIKIEH